ncbi:2-haloacid dehalogenase/putative hydrolase of the HAD superfamily/5'-nucleotidase [Neolewinella xylanilytica]|uniref:2-haloacid dehalogenase/putative hydrolase of the HAD superfamily/5'-nucleotidase n=1 Tax=Neolewinella xylanilytica TaxID=1514080 RepID=A0A2S6HZW2_9BACT|nr:YjjG family noncanonical pyrimidine nucleotidase [Neolewinella xylanilytica]PPK84063.1 2-haloacid dehalogenase/putative hydrolase of the HAD superfamily/5'-nucleotidase [Neolewinella xylanilytica]
MYTWLLFDADNTIWDFDAAEAHALEQTLLERDIAWSVEVLSTYRLINREAWDDYEKGRLPKEQLRDIRFRRLLEHYRHDHPAEQLSLTYRNYLAASHHLLPGALTVLETVKQNYRLGLITNGLSEVQRPRLANTGIAPYFEFIAISDELGVAKPHAAFFEHAHTQMGGPDPSEVLVIGDNPNADILGALSYGFDACWLRHPGTANRKHLGETMRIRTIMELLDHL